MNVTNYHYCGIHFGKIHVKFVIYYDLLGQTFDHPSQYMRVSWCSGSHSGLVIRGLVVRVLPDAHAPILYFTHTLLSSLDPGVVNGYRQEFLVSHVHLQVAGHSRCNNNKISNCKALMENYLIIIIIIIKRYINRNNSYG